MPFTAAQFIEYIKALDLPATPGMPSNGYIIYAQGNDLRRVEVNNIVSAIIQATFEVIDTQTVTNPGAGYRRYRVLTPNTFQNVSPTITVSQEEIDNNWVYIVVQDGVATKELEPKPDFGSRIKDWSASEDGLEHPAVRIKNRKIYRVISGQIADGVDEPDDPNSTVWELVVHDTINMFARLNSAVNNIGDMGDLQTFDTSSLVNAINEVLNLYGGGNSNKMYDEAMYKEFADQPSIDLPESLPYYIVQIGSDYYFASDQNNVEQFSQSRIYIPFIDAKVDLEEADFNQNGYDFYDLGSLDSGLVDLETYDFQFWLRFGGSGSGVFDKAPNGGIFIKDRDEDNYGDIGENAFDASVHVSGTGNGATGIEAIAIGFKTSSKGDYSNAIGRGSKTVGNSSNAIGAAAIAEGGSSNAIGRGAIAEGDFSNAIGVGAKSPGDFSNAIGRSAGAEGDRSNAIGHGAKAFSFNETVIGSYGTPYAPVSKTAWDASDRSFAISIGEDEQDRKDGLRILKSGLATVPEQTEQMITDNPKAIVTSEYLTGFAPTPTTPTLDQVALEDNTTSVKLIGDSFFPAKDPFDFAQMQDLERKGLEKVATTSNETTDGDGTIRKVKQDYQISGDYVIDLLSDNDLFFLSMSGPTTFKFDNLEEGETTVREFVLIGNHTFSFDMDNVYSDSLQFYDGTKNNKLVLHVWKLNGQTNIEIIRTPWEIVSQTAITNNDWLIDLTQNVGVYIPLPLTAPTNFRISGLEPGEMKVINMIITGNQAFTFSNEFGGGIPMFTSTLDEYDGDELNRLTMMFYKAGSTMRAEIILDKLNPVI